MFGAESFLSKRKSQYEAAVKQLEALASLPPDYWETLDYEYYKGVKTPNRVALSVSRAVMFAFYQEGLCPLHVSPHVDEGVNIRYGIGEQAVDVFAGNEREEDDDSIAYFVIWGNETRNLRCEPIPMTAPGLTAAAKEVKEFLRPRPWYLSWRK